MVEGMNVPPVARAHRSQPEKVAEISFLAVLFLVALLANSTICSAMLQPYRLKTPGNLLPFSLMLASLCLVLVHMPFSMVSVLKDQWPFGDAWCQASGMLINLTSVASNLSIVSVAIYRYYLVVRPLAIKISIHRARTMVVFVWFSSLVSSVPPLFGWNSYVYVPGKAFCSVNWEDGGPSLLYSIYLVAVSLVVPFVVLLFLYCGIYLRAKQQRKRTHYNTLRGLSGAYLKKPSGIAHSANQRVFSCLTRVESVNSVSSPSASDIGTHPSPTTSTSAFSLENPPAGSASLPTDEERRRRKQALRQALRSHSAIYEQKTVQNAFILLLFFALNVTPYYVTGIWSGFSQRSSPSSLDFIVSWIFVSMTAVNPTLYGLLNRPVRRAVRTSAIGKFVCQLLRCARDEYEAQPRHSNGDWARRNEGLESEC